MKESKVYLIQEPNSEKDLSSAAKQGKIVTIFSSHEKPAFNVPESLQRIYESLLSFDQKNDSICFAGGDPLLEFLVGIVVERLQFEQVTHLVWNRERDSSGEKTGKGYYIPKIIHLVG